MAKQLELVPPPPLQLQPEPGRAGPRLWVRRLAVWSEPGKLVRDVHLRPGLNIVWSPDPADRADDAQGAGALGHGSGKTLFCRLLRFCLGEDRFAPESQRDRIALAFPDGTVGSEVILDGALWSILRPIGTRRRHVAVQGVALDIVAAGDASATGIEPFLTAVECAFIPREVAATIPGGRDRRAWLAALAWLTRDQECRFDHVLDWRATGSDSDSPVRDLARMEILDVLRVLLKAIVPEERQLRLEVANLERQRDRAEGDVAHRQWEAAQTRARLIAALGLLDADLPPERLAVEPLRSAARRRVSLHSGREVVDDVANLTQLRRDRDAARDRVGELDAQHAAAEARIPLIAQVLSVTRGELPGASMSTFLSEHPVCLVCEVPIDRALAEGCKLSHKLPDLEQARQRRATLEESIRQETERLDQAKQRETELAADRATARVVASQLQARVVAAERVRDEGQAEWYAARRLVDDAGRLDELHVEADANVKRIAEMNTNIEDRRGRVAAYREQHEAVFRRLTKLFDGVVRYLVRDEALGKVRLTGTGLDLVIEMGGERSTAAIDSLKVLAFDLAAMCMSVEGATYTPAFLLHDSPREADLGLSAYQRLFHLGRSLEGVGVSPRFQYIVTTTTRPPEDVCKPPWLCLELGGAPAERRLLGRDL